MTDRIEELAKRLDCFSPSRADAHEAAQALQELRDALKGIFVHFEPDHLDYVSNSDCGTKARQALQGAAQETDHD